VIDIMALRILLHFLHLKRTKNSFGGYDKIWYLVGIVSF